MKKFIVLSLVIFFCPKLFSQVGINNTSPNATLDISASSVAAPNNDDGILIPRIDDFPSTNPTTTQDGMMVFATGNGTPAKGFYYWDNGSSSWVSVSSAGGTDDDWYEENTTAPPTSNSADIFTDGNVGIGVNSVLYPLQIATTTASRTINTLNENTGSSVYGMRNTINESATSSNGSTYGIFNSITRTNQGAINGVSNTFQNSVSTNSFGYLYGFTNSFGNSTSTTSFGLLNRFQGVATTASGTTNLIGNSLTTFYGVDNHDISGSGISGNFYGLYNNISDSGNGARYGVYTLLSETGSGNKYGEYIEIPTAAGGTHYGIYSDVQSATGYAGYFLGRTSLGTGTTNRYLMPATDGSNGQVMTTNGAGQVSFSTITGAEKIDDLTDGKSDNDGSNDGSSIFLGVDSGRLDDSSDNRNVGIGYNSLYSTVNGQHNTGVGYRTLFTNSTGYENTAMGYEALWQNTTGYSNSAFGNTALFSNTSGFRNTAVGNQSLFNNTSGDYNVAIGQQALMANTTSNYNTAVGYGAMVSNTTGLNNVALGAYSMQSISTGQNNTFIGFYAGRSSGDTDGNIFLGYYAGQAASGGNQLFIENSGANANNALIYGEFDNDILRTNSEFQIGNPAGTGYAFPRTDGTVGQVLTSDGSGNISFTTPSPGGVTLDGAYDFGGAGAGRTIYAENGAVTINRNSDTAGSALDISLNSTYSLSERSAISTSNAYPGGLETYTNIYRNSGPPFGQGLLIKNNASSNINGRDGVAIEFSQTATSNFGNDNRGFVYDVTYNGGSAATLYGYKAEIEGSGNAAKYGAHITIPSTSGGNHYGIFSDVRDTGGYAGFFLGRTSFGTGTTNRYLMPATDGTAGQVMTTNGAGVVTFQDVTGTDDQTIDQFDLSGTTLRLSIEDDGQPLQTLNLSSLQDGTGTDDQTIDAFSLVGTTLNLSLESDGQPNQTVNLSSLQDGNTQNTLDEAYDEGGTGVGRTITADNGALTIAGDDGFMVTGTYGTGNIVAVTGLGTRMFFNPNKGAFRAGSVGNGGIFDPTAWNDANIGPRSFAVNIGTFASGSYSFASGLVSVASGYASTAMGENTIATGWGEMAVGSYNRAGTARVFVVGNGTSDASRSNALEVFDSGLITFNEEYTFPLADGTANQVLQTNGAGTLSWTTSLGESSTASNGLTEVGDDIQLGGTLTQNTTITNGNFDLEISSTGTATDALIINKTDNSTLTNTALDINKTTNGSGVGAGVIVAMSGTGTGTLFSYDASITSSGASTKIAYNNVFSGTGTGTQYGNRNQFFGAGSGTKYGVHNSFGTSAISTKYGVYNDFDSSSGNYYGMNNNMVGATNSAVFGLYNTLSGTGTGAKTGVSNLFSGANGNLNIYIGMDNSFSDTGNGDRWGMRNNLDGTGSGTHYGTFNDITGTGSGTKYGTYNYIDSGAGGTHYGTYNEVSNANGWAGYFVGKNYVSIGLGINNPNPDGRLDIIHNSTGATSPHIMLTAQNANTGTRITFDNAAETTNNWVLFTRADDTSGSGVFNIYSSEVGTNVMRLESDGKMGIMRNPTTNTLEVEGQASKTTAGAFIANSDQRLKKDIASISGKTALEKIEKMRGVTYLWNDTKTGMKRPDGIQYGFIAQELMKVFPEKVTMDNLGFYQTAYGDYDPIFVEAIKELKTQVDTLKDENQNLKEKLSKYEMLEARISALENDNLSTITAEIISEKKK